MKWNEMSSWISYYEFPVVIIVIEYFQIVNWVNSVNFSLNGLLEYYSVETFQI